MDNNFNIEDINDKWAYEQIIKVIDNNINIDLINDDYIKSIYYRELLTGFENIISWIDIHKDASVLEINAGCGAATKYILKKTQEIICLEESLYRSKVNIKMNEAAGLKELYVGKIVNNLSNIEKKFDYIIVWELPCYDLKTFINDIKGKLNPKGKIFIAFSNMKGVSNLVNMVKKVNVYERMSQEGINTKEYFEAALQDIAIEKYNVYYPYPDFCYAEKIFSDDYLPVKGELTKGKYLFFVDNVKLMEEQVMYNNVIDKYKEYSNAYIYVIEV